MSPVALDLALVVAIDGFLEALPADEPHRVKRPALVVGAQAVNRHDARMLQPAGDLGLDQETGAADRIVGVLHLDLLERDLAVKLGIDRHVDDADASLGRGAAAVESGRPANSSGRV